MIPQPANKQELLDILDDIRAGVEANDTFEGFVEFSISISPPHGQDPEEADFMVRATWRVGNSMGQGSVRSFGPLVPGEPEADESRE